MLDTAWMDYAIFIGVALLCLFVSFRVLQSTAHKPVAKQNTDPAEDTLAMESLSGIKLTLQQLSEFDGVKNKAIYLAIKGVIFDVTSGKDHYGKGTHSIHGT